MKSTEQQMPGWPGAPPGRKPKSEDPTDGNMADVRATSKASFLKVWVTTQQWLVKSIQGEAIVLLSLVCCKKRNEEQRTVSRRVRARMCPRGILSGKR